MPRSLPGDPDDVMNVAAQHGPRLAEANAAARRRVAARRTLRMLQEFAPAPDSPGSPAGAATIDAETLAVWTHTVLAEKRDPATLRANGLWVTVEDTRPLLEAVQKPEGSEGAVPEPGE